MTSPAPWKLVPMAARVPNRCHAQARTSSVGPALKLLVQGANLRRR